jgi:hypothetical protein
LRVLALPVARTVPAFVSLARTLPEAGSWVTVQMTRLRLTISPRTSLR